MFACQTPFTLSMLLRVMSPDVPSGQSGSLTVFHFKVFYLQERMACRRKTKIVHGCTLALEIAGWILTSSFCTAARLALSESALHFRRHCNIQKDNSHVFLTGDLIILYARHTRPTPDPVHTYS